MIVKQVIRYTNAPCLEATWVDENDVVIKCHAYSNHPEQMAQLRADLGADAAQYEDMIAEVEATYVPPEPAPAPSQFEKDQTRYQKRAAVKDQLMAYMAADNMSRVRSGVWTVADLTSLMGDPQLAAATNYMSTLSFELAAQVISQAQTALLTQEIRDNWVSRLQEHFYLEG